MFFLLKLRLFALAIGNLDGIDLCLIEIGSGHILLNKVLAVVSIDEDDFLARLDDMVEQAFDDQCTGANPRYPLMSEIKQMYLNAYYGNSA